MARVSAGILLYRHDGELQVLLAHPGGPFWRSKDTGAWTIPKGEVHESEEPLAAARREFAEETGHRPNGEALYLGDERQPSGKRVHVWAIQGDWAPNTLVSAAFDMEWPPRSGKMQSFPEIDRAAWFDIEMARRKILPGQAVFLDRLRRAIA